MNTETRQELFSYMRNEHGLTLLENELDEIERILGDKVEFAKTKCKEQREICAKKADYYMIELGEFGIIFPTVRIKRKEIKNAPTPDFE